MAAAESDGSLWTQSGRVVFSVGGGQPGFGDPQAVLQVTSFLGSPQPLSACGDALEMQKAFFGGAADVTLPVRSAEMRLGEVADYKYLKFKLYRLGSTD